MIGLGYGNGIHPAELDGEFIGGVTAPMFDGNLVEIGITKRLDRKKDGKNKFHFAGATPAPGSLGAGPVHISAPAGGKLGFVARGVGRPILLNGDTGRFSRLEGADLVRPESCTYSADGRLLAATGMRYVKKEVVAGFGPGGPPPMGGPPMQTSISPAGEFLNVWDTRTGKLVKSWPANFPVVAFHPTKPILAVLERNGQNQTRLGLWDFAAEVPAKK